jgi:ketosteroid isomerase-like protein
MQESAELKELMVRWYASFSAGDLAAIERILSHEPGVLAIGSDPQEWFLDYETIVAIFQAQVQAMNGVQLQAGDLTAYCDGAVGWVADQPVLKLPDGRAIPLRSTFVFHQENGEWKLVQVHQSVGVANEELLGKALPV